ncbi:DUF4014 family protein [Serratia sp. IR-2025]
MKKYRRNRMKDAVIVAAWVVAVLPIFPIELIIMLHDHVEKFADWYDGLIIQPIRNWRNKWNPIKEE